MKRLTLSLIALAPPAFADPAGNGHLMDWGHGHGVGLMFGALLWLVVLGLIVAAGVWFLRSLDPGARSEKPNSALAELDLRFARGEIDAEEYSERKKLLIG